MTTTSSLIRIYCETIIYQDLKETKAAWRRRPILWLKDCWSSQAGFILEPRHLLGTVKRKDKMEDIWDI